MGRQHGESVPKGIGMSACGEQAGFLCRRACCARVEHHARTASRMGAGAWQRQGAIQLLAAPHTGQARSRALWLSVCPRQALPHDDGAR